MPQVAGARFVRRLRGVGGNERGEERVRDKKTAVVRRRIVDTRVVYVWIEAVGSPKGIC